MEKKLSFAEKRGSQQPIGPIQHQQQQQQQTLPTQPSSPTAKSSYVPFNHVTLHEHDHRQTPHMHTQLCDRYTSGLDKNRQYRFYFTKNKTPCRVYMLYNEKLASNSFEMMTSLADGLGAQVLSNQVNPALNGRKLSPKTLRSQLKISPQYIDEAKNLIFVRENMSLVPVLPTINTNTNTGGQFEMTMAEMAVLPINLPTIVTNEKQVNKAKHESKVNPYLKQNKLNRLNPFDSSTANFDQRKFQPILNN